MRPGPPTPQGTKLLHDGLALHKAGDFKASLAKFEAALALAPDDALARFDVACAAARLGDRARAEAELTTLIDLDLPAFRSRFATDADLADLRVGPEGGRLSEHARAVEQAYRRALAVGASTLMFRARPASHDASIVDPVWMRAGVWVHSAKRFFALVKEVPATTAWIDRARKTALVAEVHVGDCATDFCPRLGDVELSVFDLLVDEPKLTARRSYPDDLVFSILFSAGESAWMTVERGQGADHRRLEPKGLVPSPPPPADAEVMELEVSPRGTLQSRHPQGFRVERGELVPPAGPRIKLGAGHAAGARSIVVRGSHAVVATSDVGCDCDHGEASVSRHAISIVDLASGSVTSFDKGPDAAALELEDGGAVYVQTGERVRRFESIEAMRPDGGELLPSGVLLVVPRNASNNCCGL